MPTGQPMWRRGVEAVDRLAAPVLEGATRHEVFGLGVSLLQQARNAAYRRTERVSRKVLHGLNLPTASDVNRLLAQIAAVENRVRQLDTRIEGQLPSPKHPGALPSPANRTSRTSATAGKDGPPR